MATPGNDRKPFYWCIRFLKWVPVIFILTIVMWSYYAYVIQLCFITIESPLLKTVYILFYHLFFIMFLWSYWQTIFTEVATVPSNFRIPVSYFETLSNSSESAASQNSVIEAYAKNLPVVNVTLSGAPRICDKCKVIKPDRAHHCSVCGVCVLKMDHHCPWINNCVSFTNYKFFVLFLGYALLFCMYISLTSLSYFISFWKGDLQGLGKFHILFLFCVAFMFGISLMSLFGYHCYLVFMNRTTLEAFRPPSFRMTGPDKYGFHVGKCKNFQEVFGEDPKMWLLPIGSGLGDGVTFPRRLVSMT